MNILITGASGFIGYSLIERLAKEKHDIFCIDRNNTLRLPYRNTYILCADITSKTEYLKFPKNIDVIIHLAATMNKNVTEKFMYEVNTLGTLNLLSFGKEANIKSFIYASSGAVYGYSYKYLKENSKKNPIGFYGLTKYHSEKLIEYYSANFTTIIFRLFFPYGPNQKKGIIPTIVERVSKGDTITVFNNNNPKINPVYITDVTNALISSLKLKGNHIFNIAGDEIISIKEIAEMIGLKLNKKLKFQYENDKSVKNLIGDNSKIKKELYFKCSVKIEDGIENFLKALK